MPTFSRAEADAGATGGWASWQRGARLCVHAPLALFVLATLAQFAGLMPDIVHALAPQATSTLSGLLVVQLAAVLLEAGFYAGLIACIDRLATGDRRPVLARVLEPRRVIALAVAGIIYNILVGIGLVLFILPGVFFSIALLFFAFPIVLHDAGPLAGLGASFDCVSNRFWRISAALSVALLVYSVYVVVTWVPGLIGIDWPSLMKLSVAAQRGSMSLAELSAQANSLVTPPSVAAPLWFFVLNPLLGGVVMPPVLAALYGVWRRFQPASAAS
ncbi:MAG TPA: hypothetical protein VFK96_06035 [Gammaproteobacteria bacterium]|nr:hypothetical protein [Gammaproteobacteria bacterium]